MGGRAPLDPPMISSKTRMPGKWGGARRARPPLDPPMSIAAGVNDKNIVVNKMSVQMTGQPEGRSLLVYALHKFVNRIIDKGPTS